MTSKTMIIKSKTQTTQWTWKKDWAPTKRTRKIAMIRALAVEHTSERLGVVRGDSAEVAQITLVANQRYHNVAISMVAELF
jgi:hypothetical protein